MLDAEAVRQLLEYDPTTGEFTWIKREGDTRGVHIWNTRFAGKMAGRISSYGYREIAISSRLYKAHRLAWIYMTGEWPTDQIDHIDGDRLNNRLVNLRPATREQNAHNCRRHRDNKTGFKGVAFYKPTGKFHAVIASYGKKFSLGYFPTPEDAHAAYCIAAKRLHGEFARAA
jgi:hypothetical protein